MNSQQRGGEMESRLTRSSERDRQSIVTPSSWQGGEIGERMVGGVTIPFSELDARVRGRRFVTSILRSLPRRARHLRGRVTSLIHKTSRGESDPSRVEAVRCWPTVTKNGRRFVALGLLHRSGETDWRKRVQKNNPLRVSNQRKL